MLNFEDLFSIILQPSLIYLESGKKQKSQKKWSPEDF